MKTIPITIWGKLDPEDHYLCSIDGDVISTCGGETKLLKLSNDGAGYLRFGYCKDGIEIGMRVHRFVAMIFLWDTFVQGLQACHYDGKKLNNKLENLRWDTRKGNGADAIRHGTIAKGELSGRSKLTEEQVLQIPGLRAEGLTQQAIGDLFGVSNTLICEIMRGKGWQHLKLSL